MSISREVNYQFTHIVNVLKGGPVNARLEHVAPVADAQTGLFQGSLVSLNGDGKFVVGLSDAKAMPMWSHKNEFDPDVTQGSYYVTGGSNKPATQSITGGTITAFVATGGFQLQTTEFTGDASEFTPNAYLTADDSAKGKVKITTEAPYGKTAIVGVVTSGKVRVDERDIKRLAFWPVFLPGTGAGA